jgi:hypothetical protein
MMDGPDQLAAALEAFWGDPVADFVSLALLGDIERDEAFLWRRPLAGCPPPTASGCTARYGRT